MSLYLYQKEWVADKSRFKAGMVTRQGGKSFMASLSTVDSTMEAMTRGEQSLWVCLSAGERQSLELMDKVKLHAEAMGTVIDAIEDEYRIEDQKFKLLQVTFPNKSRIIGLPANPLTARGFSGNVLLDEFAFHQDSHKIWKALFPTISRGFRIEVISTPNGKNNKFYELMTSAKGWSRHVVDIYKAVDQGLPFNIDELREGINDDDAWAQEYELKWLDEAHAWLSYDLINSAEHDRAGVPENYAGGPCYVGVDIAARKHNFVIWVKELVGDVLWTREKVVRRNISFQKQDDLLADVMRRYNVVRVCMDQTGMGEKPVEDAKRKYGSLRVEGVVFNLASKLLLATLIKQAYEDRKVRIPMNDDMMRRDLHKIKRESTATGAARFVADDKDDDHADQFWAQALAISASGRKVGPAEYTSVSRNEHDDDDDDPEDRRWERFE